MLYVLDGTLTLRLGDETIELPGGSLFCVPPGMVHTFSNPGEAPFRFLKLQHARRLGAHMQDLAGALAKWSDSQVR